MLKADIKRAEALLQREGTRSAEDRLILAVKASAKAASIYKPELKEALLREYGASEVKRLGRGGDMVVGFLTKARNVGSNYRAFDADLAGLLVDGSGNVVGYYHSGEVVTIRPDDMTLRGAACVDDNSETHQDIMACAEALVYGSGRGRNAPWYATTHGTRYNPARPSRRSTRGFRPF